MNYEEFVENIRECVEQIASRELDNYKVVIRRVTKNNNIRKRALSIVKEGQNATPTIYLDKFYEDYRKGYRIGKIAEDIFQVYKNGMRKFEKEIDIDHIMDFDKIKDRIYVRVINRELNKVLLADIPHKDRLDLSLVYYLEVSASGYDKATALIHNYHIGHWNVTAEELHKIAFTNTITKRKHSIVKIEDVIKDMIMQDILNDADVVREDCEYDGKSYNDIEQMVEEELDKYKDDYAKEMYVLTNEIKFDGAVCMFYPDVLKDFADEIDSDLSVIPSSIHEVLLVPKYENAAQRLTEVLNEVNSKELDPMEILSSRIYEYDRITGELL